MQKLDFDNNGKSPNLCHEYLITNGIKPISFEHNRIYDDMGNMTLEATKFLISVKDTDTDQTTLLVNQFIAQ